MRSPGLRRPTRAVAALLPCFFPALAAAQELGRESARGDLWSFQTPDGARALASLPAAPRRENPIDSFIAAKLAEKGLSPAPRAEPRTLVRRAAFDLLGLPPAPEDIERFAADPSPEAWAALIERLLASPHYGERWGRHWLDVARYADSGGYETDVYFRHAWRYRDYVVKSFNDDKPYDRFVQEQIAGDEIWPNDLELDGSYVMAPEKLAALEAHTGTGFYALGPQVHESNMDGRKLGYERLTDWVDATGAAFLGMTLACARCHDHKFDPITQRDYFGLQAVFAASKEIERPIVNAMEIADFKQHYPRILAVDAARRAYRLFEARLAGRAPTPEESAKRQELLAEIGRKVLELPERASSSPNTPFDGLMEIPAVAVLGHERPELVKPIHVLERGEIEKPLDPVAPALPAALARATGAPAALPEGIGSRKALALWLTRPEHPLTARVFVNRIWQWHFGRGLVATANDFGRMGEAPSHPELLDWLASELIARGWRVKALHRLILSSRTYQMASGFSSEDNLRVDPENRFLWRFPRRRLEGEALWDALHAAAGTLNPELGGPPVMPPLADEELASMRERYQWVVSPDPRQHARRGLYILSRRNFRFPLFDIFDAPVNAVSCSGRDVTTVAPQALWFLNNGAAVRQSVQLAARVLREAGPSPEAWIERLWRVALGRPPAAEERREALSLLESLSPPAAPPLEHAPPELAALPAPRAAGLAKLCLAVFNLNEFAYVD